MHPRMKTEAEHEAENRERTRSYSPRSVPGVWSGMFDSTHTEISRAHLMGAIQTGEQLFYGGGPDLATGAGAVCDWNRQVLESARLYHFSASLMSHAIDCEADFPAWEPTWHDFPTRYGMVVLERPIRIRHSLISVFTWGPGPEWQGELTYYQQAAYSHSNADVKGRIPERLRSAWMISAWTPTISTERAGGMGPLSSEHDFFVPVWFPGSPASIEELEHPHREGENSNFPRVLKIAFDLATQASIATSRAEPIPKKARKQIDRRVPVGAGPVDVLVHDLRPRLAEAVAGHDSEGPISRADAKYRLRCWQVRPVIDRETGKLLKKGYIAYRDPALLGDSPASPTEVWRGTDPGTIQ